MSKIGNSSFSIKIGNNTVQRIYLGSILIYILLDNNSYVFDKDQIYSWI